MMNRFRRHWPLGDGRNGARELHGKLELDHFIWTIEGRNLDRTETREVADHVRNQLLRRGSACGDADGAQAVEPVPADLATVRDEMGRDPHLGRNLAEPVRVRTVLRAYDQDHLDLLAQLAHRPLAILRRVADVFRLGAHEVAEAPFERADDRLGVVDAERGLCDVAYRRVPWNLQSPDIGLRLDQRDGSGDLPKRSLDLRVAGMPDEDHRPALHHVLLGLVMHLGHQRTRRVVDRQASRGRLFPDPFRHAVGAEDRDGIVRHLGQLFHEPRPLRLQEVDDALVVDDFMPHIDRSVVLLQRTLDDVDRPHDAGAKAPRFPDARREKGKRAGPERPTRGSRLSASNTLATTLFASSLALAYMAAGSSCSWNRSGKTIERARSAPSSRPCSRRRCMTCEPNPPIDPSSIVISASCSSASLRIRSMSSGLAKRASATVVERPNLSSSSAALRHSARRAPRLRRATSPPSRTTRALPILSGRGNSGSGDPTPSPRG